MQWEQVATEVVAGGLLLGAGYVVRLVHADLGGKKKEESQPPCPTPTACQQQIEHALKEHIDLRFIAGFSEVKTTIAEFKADLPKILNGPSGYLRKPEWNEARQADRVRLDSIANTLEDLKQRVEDIE